MSLAWDLSIQDQEAQLKVAELFVKIRKRSLFSFLPQSVSADLVRDCTALLKVQAGVVVPRHLPNEEMLIVGSGVVGVYTSDSEELKISSVSEGRSLELKTWLAGELKWAHTWRAETDAELLRVDTKAFKQCLESVPGLEKYLRLVTEHPAVQRLTKDLRLTGLTPAQVQKTVTALKASDRPEVSPEDLQRGTLFVVQAGEILVRGDIHGSRKSLGHFSAGDVTYLKQQGPELGQTVSENKEEAADVQLHLEVSSDAQYLSLSFDEWVDLIGAKHVQRFTTMVNSVAETMLSLQALETHVANPERRPLVQEEDDGLSVGDFTVTPEAQKRQRRRRYPNVKQHDQMDCGAAVLATVSRFYGKKVDIAQFRPLVHVTREGATMAGIKKGARAAGFTAMGLYAPLKALRKLQMPLIALMQYHYIVVNEITDTEVIVSDPAVGNLRHSHESFAREFSKNILVLKPNPSFQNLAEADPSWRKYLLIFEGKVHVLAQICLLTVLSFGLGLASPMVQQYLYDGVLMQRKFENINGLAIVLLVVGLISQGLGWLQSYLTLHFTTAVDAKFSALFLRHMLRLPLSYYALRQVGDFTGRLGELGKIRGFFQSKPISLTLQIASLFIYSGVIFFYNPWILLFIFSVLPVMLGFIIVMTPRLLAVGMLTFRATAQMNSRLIEHFRNHETIQAIAGEVAARWTYDQALIECQKHARGAAILGATFGTASSLLNSFLTTGVLVLSIYFYIHEQLTFGQVMAVAALSGQVVGPAMALLGEWQNFSQMKVSFGRVDDVLTESDENAGELPFQGELTVKGKVEFKGVTFQYGADHSPIVLDEVSLTIEEGETVALVGRSGSGKSTLAFMINRLYQPTKGGVFIDGQDVRSLPISRLRRKIAVIMQDNNLFSGSILENITLGDPNPSFDRAMAAAVQADAHGFVTRLPKGYSHHLPEGGTGLSGGQRQRLTIARALYLDPPILIMDEATSALDAISEQTIVNNIRARQGKRTTVIIAHRLNTIMHADRIVLLDQGRIAEAGTHQQLMSQQGHYYELFRKQLRV